LEGGGLSRRPSLICPISDSKVARITGISHWYLACIFLFVDMCTHFKREVTSWEGMQLSKVTVQISFPSNVREF
jgi:hypothetical protein